MQSIVFEPTCGLSSYKVSPGSYGARGTTASVVETYLDDPFLKSPGF